MKMGEVAKLLEGLALGLADLSKKTSEGLLEFQVSIQPFADQTFDQFAVFLKQCEEYKRTGVVAAGRKKAPGKAVSNAEKIADGVGKVRALLAEINAGTVTSSRIDALLSDLKKGLTKPQWDELLAALAITGKTKTKDQAVEKVKQVLNSQLEMYVKGQAFTENRPPVQAEAATSRLG